MFINIRNYSIRLILVATVIYSGYGIFKYFNSKSMSRVDGAIITAPKFSIPFSSYSSQTAESKFVELVNKVEPNLGFDVMKARAYYDLENAERLERATKKYSVSIESTQIAGVTVHVVSPESGPSLKNKDKILINLHGGGFLWGANSGAKLEAVPIAATMGIKVVAVDYRLGPENKFPAATDDALVVYAELVKEYKHENIGIYGCSAGGMLTTQLTASLILKNIPLPGAIGVFCGAGGNVFGDSSFYGNVLLGDQPAEVGAPSINITDLPYFYGADQKSPTVSPVLFPEILEHFPPTLMISGSRDFALSSVLNQNIQLAKAGVQTELFVWDGMWHAFFMDVDIPESEEVFKIVSKFFDRYLGD